MRKLKLQINITLDGFVAGPEGELDWMTFDTSEPMADLVNELTDSSDTILMGRKMTSEFVNYWENIVNHQPDSPEFEFAGKMVAIPKVIFSKSVTSVEGRNTRVENGDLINAVRDLKSADGSDIIVYGGAGFVSAMIEKGLIDEYNLFFNPVSLGEGMRIFSDRTKLKLVDSRTFESGVVFNRYNPADR